MSSLVLLSAPDSRAQELAIEAMESETPGDPALPCTTNQVLEMTGPTSPANTVTRSGVYSSAYEAWQLFDASTSSSWISQVGQSPAWVDYDWGTTNGSRAISRYAVTFANGSLTSRAPRSWTLEGSNGGVVWAVVDTRTNETNWSGFERREYGVSFASPYRQYRLNITDDNDPSPGIVVVSMSNLELLGCVCRPNEQAPTMTGPTTPSGIVTRSGAYSAAHEAWKAFDLNDNDTSTSWISQVGQTPAWIAYDWSNTGAKFLSYYAVTFANGSLTSRAPRSWTVWGLSALTGTWSVIDTRTKETGWAGVERRFYWMTPGHYSQVRMEIKDDNDPAAGIVVISMSDLTFLGCSDFW